MQYNQWKSTALVYCILPFIHRIAHHPKLVKAVQQALDTTNILLWSSDLNIKEPNTDFFPHQDSTHAGLQPAIASA
jgi:hypothetical protein